MKNIADINSLFKNSFDQKMRELLLDSIKHKAILRRIDQTFEEINEDLIKNQCECLENVLKTYADKIRSQKDNLIICAKSSAKNGTTEEIINHVLYASICMIEEAIKIQKYFLLNEELSEEGVKC